MKHILLCLVLSVIVGCHWTAQEKYFAQGETQYEAKEWQKALESYEKLAKTSPDSDQALVGARKAAHIADIELNDHQALIFFLRFIVLHTKDESERASAQRTLALVYFEKLGDNKQAVVELNRALDLMSAREDQTELRLMLARSHFLLNQFFQARSEIDRLLKEKLNEDAKFKAILLKANIFLNERKLEEAANLFKQLMEEFPQRSKAEQVALNLAVCYEEQENFDKAIEVLETLRADSKDSDLVDLKIQRVKERREQAPGAKGLKK